MNVSQSKSAAEQAVARVLLSCCLPEEEGGGA